MSRLNQLLNKEVTRKQFLATLGIGVISLFGLSSIMGLLSEGDYKRIDHGYGDGTYGH